MGGIYPSPSFLGSRSPAMAVSALGILLANGKDRYATQARIINEAIGKIKKFVTENLRNLSIIGNPFVNSI